MSKNLFYFFIQKLSLVRFLEGWMNVQRLWSSFNLYWQDACAVEVTTRYFKKGLLWTLTLTQTHAHTHTHTRIHTHAHTHTPTHAHTQTQKWAAQRKKQKILIEISVWKFYICNRARSDLEALAWFKAQSK